MKTNQIIKIILVLILILKSIYAFEFPYKVIQVQEESMGNISGSSNFLVKAIYNKQIKKGNESKVLAEKAMAANLTTIEKQKSQIEFMKYLIALGYKYYPLYEDNVYRSVDLAGSTNGLIINDINTNDIMYDKGLSLTTQYLGINLDNLSNNDYLSHHSNTLNKYTKLSKDFLIGNIYKNPQGYNEVNTYGTNLKINGVNELNNIINKIMLMENRPTPEEISEWYKEYDKNAFMKKKFKDVLGITKEELPLFEIEFNFYGYENNKLSSPGIVSRQYYVNVPLSGQIEGCNFIDNKCYQTNKPNKTEIISNIYIPHSNTDKDLYIEYEGNFYSDNRYKDSSGQIIYPEIRNTKFEVITDDGVRVWINDKLVLNKFFSQGATKYTFNADIKKGLNKIELQYFDQGGKKVLSLKMEDFDNSNITRTQSCNYDYQWWFVYLNNLDNCNNITYGNWTAPLKYINNDKLISNIEGCESPYFIYDKENKRCIYDKNKDISISSNKSIIPYDKETIELKSGTNEKIEILSGKTLFNPHLPNNYVAIDFIPNKNNTNQVIANIVEMEENKNFEKCIKGENTNYLGLDINDEINIYTNNIYDEKIKEEKNRIFELNKSNIEKITNLYSNSSEMLENIKQEINNNDNISSFIIDNYSENLKDDISIEDILLSYNGYFTVDEENSNYIVLPLTDLLSKQYTLKGIDEIIIKEDNVKEIYEESNEELSNEENNENISTEIIGDFKICENNNILSGKYSKYIFNDKFVDISLKYVLDGLITDSIIEEKYENCEKISETTVTNSDILNRILLSFKSGIKKLGYGLLKTDEEIELNDSHERILLKYNNKKVNGIYVDYNYEIDIGLDNIIQNINTDNEILCNTFINFNIEEEEKIIRRLNLYKNLSLDIKKNEFPYKFVDNTSFGNWMKSNLPEYMLDKPKKLKCEKNLRWKPFKFYWAKKNAQNFCSAINTNYQYNGNTLKNNFISYINNLTNELKNKINENMTFDEIITFAENYKYYNLKDEIFISKMNNDNNTKKIIIKKFLLEHDYSKLLNGVSYNIAGKNFSFKGINDITVSNGNGTLSCTELKVKEYPWQKKYETYSTYKSWGTIISELIDDYMVERNNLLETMVSEVDGSQYYKCVNDLQANGNTNIKKKTFNYKTMEDQNLMKYLIKINDDNQYNQNAVTTYTKNIDIEGNKLNDINKLNFQFQTNVNNNGHLFCENVIKEMKPKEDIEIPLGFKSVFGYKNGNFTYNRFYNDFNYKSLWEVQNGFQPMACVDEVTTGKDFKFTCKNVAASEGDLNRDDVIMFYKPLDKERKYFLNIEFLNIESLINNDYSGSSSSLIGAMELNNEIIKKGNHSNKSSIDKIVEECYNFKGQYEYKETKDFYNDEVTYKKDYYNENKQFAYKIPNTETYVNVNNCSEITNEVISYKYNQNIQCEDGIQAMKDLQQTTIKDNSQLSYNDLSKSTSEEMESFQAQMKQAQNIGGFTDITSGTMDVQLTNEDKAHSVSISNQDKWTGDDTATNKYDVEGKYKSLYGDISTSDSSIGGGFINNTAINDSNEKLSNVINSKNINTIKSQTVTNKDKYLGIDITGMDKGTNSASSYERIDDNMKINNCEDCDKEKQILWEDAENKYNTTDYHNINIEQNTKISENSLVNYNENNNNIYKEKETISEEEKAKEMDNMFNKYKDSYENNNNITNEIKSHQDSNINRLFK